MKLHTCDQCKEQTSYLLASNGLTAKEVQEERLICATCYAQKPVLEIEPILLNQYYRAYKNNVASIEAKEAKEAKKERMITGFLAINPRLDSSLVSGIDQEYLSILAQERIAQDQAIAKANKAFEINNNCTI